MLPSQPPSRPRAGPRQQPITINHQQIRHAHHLSAEPPSTAYKPYPYSNNYVPALWHNKERAISHPRSQIEALPPVALATPRVPPYGMAMIPPPQLYNPSMLHPVFFTERLRKPPFQIPVGAADVLGGRGGPATRNPCAEGYIYEEGRGTEKRSEGTKL